MRVLLGMKLQSSWQEQDLNQLAASQLELPRKRSGTGLTEITKNTGNPQLDSNRKKDLYQDLLPKEQGMW
jgi:hypothetical protein